MKPVTALLLLSLIGNGIAVYYLTADSRAKSAASGNARARTGSAGAPGSTPEYGPSAGESPTGSTAGKAGGGAGGANGFAVGGSAGAGGPGNITVEEALLAAGPGTLVGSLRMAAKIAAATSGSIQDVLSEVAGMPSSAQRATLLAQAYRRWGELNPEAAFSAIADLPLPERQAREVDILRGWALKDPGAAWNWMDENPPPVSSTTVAIPNSARYQALADSLLAADRPDLLEAALARTTNEAQRSLLSTKIADYLARYDTQGAVDWLLELPPGASRSNAAARLAKTIAEESPDLALGLATKLPGNAGRNQAIASVFAQWADSGDASVAASWLAAQKPAPVIDNALIAFLPVTAGRDESAAAALLDHFNTPENRQRAVDLAATRIALVDPARAIDWAVTQSPESPDRVKKLQPLFNAWIKKDPATASSQLFSMPGLTPNERETLSAAIPPPPPPPTLKK